MPGGAKRTNPCPYVVTLLFSPESLILMGSSKMELFFHHSALSISRCNGWEATDPQLLLFISFTVWNCFVYNSILHMHGFISAGVVSHNLLYKG